MKKGDTPELNEQWWLKNRPIRPRFSDPGLDKKLKAYEVAEDRFDYEKMLIALADIRSMAIKTISACKPAFHADSIEEVLKKYPSVIGPKEAAIKKKLVEAKQKAASKSAVRPQKIGSPVVIWSRTLEDQVKKKNPPDWLSIKGFKFELKINDDILDVLEEEKDHATPAFMAQDAEELFQEVVEEIVAEAKAIEPKVRKDPKIATELNKEVRTLAINLGEQLVKIPQARWDKFVRQKEQYKEYRIQSAKTVALGTLGVAGGALAVAAAVPTGGASLALGIVGLVRSSAGLLKVCVMLWKEAETLQEEIVADLEKLKKAYLKKSRSGAQEVGATVLKGLLGADPGFVASLPKCKEDYKNWDNKVAHLVVNNREISKKAITLLDESQKLEKLMAAAKSPEAAKLLDKIRKMRKLVENGLNEAESLGARISAAEKMEKPFKQGLDMLEEAVPKYAQIFDKVFPTVVNLALSGANAGTGFKEATDALDYYNTAQGLANDILTEIEDLVED